MGRIIKIQLELHVIRVEGAVGRLLGERLRESVLLMWVGAVERLGVEGDGDLGTVGSGIDDEDVNFLEVLEEGMEVGEMDAAAVVVAAELAFAVKDVEGVHYGDFVEGRALGVV